MIEITTGSGARFTGANYQEVLWKMYQAYNAFELEDVDYVIRADQRGQRLYPITFNYWSYMGAIADRLFRTMRISITTTDVSMFFNELLAAGVLQRISQVTTPARTWPAESAFGPLRPVRLGRENLPENSNELQMPFTVVDWNLIRNNMSNVAEPSWANQDPNIMHGEGVNDSRAQAITPTTPEPVTPPMDVAINSGVIGVADLPIEAEQVPIDIQALIDAGARPVFLEPQSDDEPGRIVLQTVDDDLIALTPEQILAVSTVTQTADIEETYEPDQLTPEQREEVTQKVEQAQEAVAQEEPRIASKRRSRAS